MIHRTKPGVSAHEYHIVSCWRVRATLDEIHESFRNPQALARWWPAAFLSVTELHAGDAGGCGKVLRVHSKGWLPYTLRFYAQIVGCRTPVLARLRVWGDFDGECLCMVEPETAGELRLTFDWRVEVRKPSVRRLSWLLKPLFRANHLWVMARGRESLELELARRRAGDERAARLPPPPGPTFPYNPAVRRVRNWPVRPVMS